MSGKEFGTCFVVFDDDDEIYVVCATIESAKMFKAGLDKEIKKSFINRESRIEEFQLRSET